MAYRITKRARERRQDRPKLGRDPDAPARADRWTPPDLRRVLTIELRRSNRIDTYRVIADGRPWRQRAGWAQVLAGIRKAMPRVSM